MSAISETATADERRDRGGRFVIGGKPGPGRPPGARSKLGEAFLEDLRDAWHMHDIEASRPSVMEDPTQLCRITLPLLPRDIDLNVTASAIAVSFAQNFRHALSLLGNEPKPKTRTIEHK